MNNTAETENIDFGYGCCCSPPNNMRIDKPKISRRNGIFWPL